MKITVHLRDEPENYFDSHATPDEIKKWEKYNGNGSYEKFNNPVNEDYKYIENLMKDAIPVRDEETFKSILF